MHNVDNSIQSIESRISELEEKCVGRFDALQSDITGLHNIQMEVRDTLNGLASMIGGASSDRNPGGPPKPYPTAASLNDVELLVKYLADDRIECEIVIPGRKLPPKVLTFSPTESRLLRHVFELRIAGVEQMHWLWGYIFNPDWIQNPPGQGVDKAVRQKCARIRKPIARLCPHDAEVEVIGVFHGDHINLVAEEGQIGDSHLKSLWRACREAQRYFDDGDTAQASAAAKDALRIDTHCFVANAIIVLLSDCDYIYPQTVRAGVPISPRMYVSQQLDCFDCAWTKYINVAAPSFATPFEGHRSEMRKAVEHMGARYEALHYLNRLCAIGARPPRQQAQSVSKPYADSEALKLKLDEFYRDVDRRAAAKFLCVGDAANYVSSWRLGTAELQERILDGLTDVLVSNKTFGSRAHLAITLKHLVFNKILADRLELQDEYKWKAACQAGDLRRLRSACEKLEMLLHGEPSTDQIVQYMGGQDIAIPPVSDGQSGMIDHTTRPGQRWSPAKTHRVLELRSRYIQSIQQLQQSGIQLASDDDEEPLGNEDDSEGD